MKIPPVFGRIAYSLMTPFLGMIFSGRLRTRALIIHESQVLLVRNWLGRQKWAFPGGGVKNKESPKEGLVRELKEELDLDIHERNLRYIYEVNHTDGNAKYPVAVFRLDLADKPSLSVRRPELINAKWWQVNDLPANIDELTEKTIKQQR